MSKRKYIIVALLAFVLALFLSGLVFDAMKRIVLPDHITLAVLRPSGSILSFFRFSLPFGLVCAAIPIAFMIVRNHFRSVVIVILSLAGGAIALFVFRHQLRAGLAFSAFINVNSLITAESLDLETIPWVSFGVIVLGTTVLRIKENQILKTNHTMLALIGLLVVCICIQMIQQIHSLRWEWEVQNRFEAAYRIQASIEQLKDSGASPEKITIQEKALRDTMTNSLVGFRPHFVPKWLQACASIGAFLSVVTLIVLWNKQRKERGSGVEPEPKAVPSRPTDGPAGSAEE